jgi:hypothetical protein
MSLSIRYTGATSATIADALYRCVLSFVLETKLQLHDTRTSSLPSTWVSGSSMNEMK